MNFFDNNTVWQANNLPDGLSFIYGVISGTPTTRGSFTVPVTVSNSLGTDTKNISIIVKHRDDCYIRQNGQIIETLTPNDLVSRIRSGEAAVNYNCSNTQLLIPLVNTLTGETINDFPLNFCDFRSFTLADSSSVNGLILQFATPLWRGLAIFDSNGFNRWKYSNLRQWLNSEGDNWFSNAYDTDALTSRQGSYSEQNILGFLSYLPHSIVDLLQPVRVFTQAFFDDDNSDSSIDDPDDLDGTDGDITFDKVFIPSLSEMNISTSNDNNYPQGNFEGSPWAYYSAPSVAMCSDIDNNSCAVLTRSALINGKTSIAALQNVNNSLTPSPMSPYSNLLATAPAFVLA